MKNTFHSIDQHKLAVFDDLLPFSDLNSLVGRYYNAAFKKNESSRPETQAYMHWAHEIELQSLSKESYWKPTLDAIKSFDEINRWMVYRAYVNFATFSDPMFSHVDSTTKELTCLWYIVPQWHIDWAGETLFYDRNDEVAFTCVPKPGRLVIFDSEIKHSGRPPSIVAKYSRFTLALKLEPKS